MPKFKLNPLNVLQSSLSGYRQNVISFNILLLAFFSNLVFSTRKLYLNNSSY